MSILFGFGPGPAYVGIRAMDQAMKRLHGPVNWSAVFSALATTTVIIALSLLFAWYTSRETTPK